VKGFLIWLIAYPLIILAMYITTHTSSVCDNAVAQWINCPR
jgi:hypothetical protein